MPERLTETAIELRRDINQLTLALPDHRRAVDKANRRAKWAIITAIVGITVGLCATIYAVDARDTAKVANTTADEVRLLQEQLKADTAAVRVAACIQFNDQRNDVRNAITDGILAFQPDGVPLTGQQQVLLNKYALRVASQLDFRDCSPEGIAEYYRNPPVDPAVVPPTTR